MPQFENKFYQDLQQPITVRHCGSLVFNADDLSNVITVDLYNGTEPATLSGTVVGAVICSDGSTVPISNGTISGNTVSITLTGACFAIPGQIGVGIQLVSGDVKTTVLKAIYNVERFTTDDVVDPDSRITLSVSDLIDDIAAAVASIPADYTDLMAAVAPTFSTDTAYTAGKYVWYDGKLYKFTTAHSAGSWNSAQVAEVALSDELTDLKNAVNLLEAGSLSALDAERGDVPIANGNGAWAWGSMNYVTPQMFGAVADGVTDDAQAIKDAIDYAMAHNLIVFIPGGTYGVSPGVIHIDFVGNDSCIIIGEGKQSCLKRIDNSLHNKFDILIVADNLDATADSNELRISGLYMDSNRRGQEVDISGGLYEAAHEICVRFHNTSDYALRSAIFEDLYFYDGIADHLGFSSSNKVRVHNIKIDGLYAWGRPQDSNRNDIDFPGYPIGNVFVHNVSCQDIHIEFNSTPAIEIPFYFSDINCRHFTVSGGNFSVYANGLQMSGALIVYHAINAHFTDCKFYLSENSYIANPYGLSTVQFIGCDFVSTDNNGSARFLNIEHYLDISFINCSFDYAGDSETTYPVTGYPLRVPMVRNPAYARRIKLSGCNISSKFDTGAYFYSCGDVFIDNMIFTNNVPFFLTGTEGKMNVYLDNVIVDTDSGYLIGGGPTLANEIYIHGNMTCNLSNLYPYTSASTFLERAIFDWICTVKISAAPTKSDLQTLFRHSANMVLIGGTELIYIGEKRYTYPVKWIVTQTGYYHYSNYDWTTLFKTIGQGYGETAERPACYLSPGFNYYDTTLNKLIVWNGTAWVNADGTAIT